MADHVALLEEGEVAEGLGFLERKVGGCALRLPEVRRVRMILLAHAGLVLLDCLLFGEPCGPIGFL